MASGSTLPQGFSLSAAGVLTVANANGASSNASFVVSACNSYSNSATIALSLSAVATPSASTALGSASASNNTVTYALGSFFTDSSGTAVTYAVTGNPYGNASVSGTPPTLSIVGANRGVTYNVTVTATNALGRSATGSVTITEVAPLYTLPDSANSSITMGMTSTSSAYTWGNNNPWGATQTAVNHLDMLGTGLAAYGASNLQTLSGSGSLSGNVVAKLAFSCANGAAIDTAGRVHVWGENAYGSLGTGAGFGYSQTPVCASLNSAGSLYGGVSVVSVSVQAVTTPNRSSLILAVDSSGMVHGWGNLNISGSSFVMGSGLVASPINLSSGWTASPVYGNVKAVSVTQTGAVLLLTTSGVIYGWGGNTQGELCIGNTTSPQTSPVAANAPGGVVFSALSAGGYGVTYALSTTGSVYWFGVVFGTYGSVSSMNNLSASGSLNGVTVKAISGSGEAQDGACYALDTTGAVHVFSFKRTSALVNTGSLAGVTVAQICACYTSCFAVDTSGNLHGFGSSWSGELLGATTPNYGSLGNPIAPALLVAAGAA